MTIGFITHGKCPRCGDELRDCICPVKCYECGDENADTFECEHCEVGFLCSDCLRDHEESSAHRARILLAAYDKGVAECDDLFEEANKAYDDGVLNAYDDYREAADTLDEMLPNFVDALRDLLGQLDSIAEK